MNALVAGIAIAYVAFSAVCVVASVLAYFDVHIPRRRKR